MAGFGTGFAAALWSETLKARRSRMPWLTALGFSLLPLAGGLFMVILKDPEWARGHGLISAKAQITAMTADWPSFVGMLAQGTAGAGLAIFGLIAIWVFGRESSDHTAKDMLALPVSREAIVAAKFVVAVVWSVVLAVLAFLLGVGLGQVIGLPGWSADLASRSAVTVGTVAGLTILVVSPFTWVASAGRGYLPPVGSMFVAVAMAQILIVLGWGPYFPWAVPILAGAAVGPGAVPLGLASYLVVVITGLVGAAGTLAWWRLADQV